MYWRLTHFCLSLDKHGPNYLNKVICTNNVVTVIDGMNKVLCQKKTLVDISQRV